MRFITVELLSMIYLIATHRTLKYNLQMTRQAIDIQVQLQRCQQIIYTHNNFRKTPKYLFTEKKIKMKTKLAGTRARVPALSFLIFFLSLFYSHLKIFYLHLRFATVIFLAATLPNLYTCNYFSSHSITLILLSHNILHSIQFLQHEDSNILSDNF